MRYRKNEEKEIVIDLSDDFDQFKNDENFVMQDLATSVVNEFDRHKGEIVRELGDSNWQKLERLLSRLKFSETEEELMDSLSSIDDFAESSGIEVVTEK